MNWEAEESILFGDKIGVESLLNVGFRVAQPNLQKIPFAENFQHV